MSVSVPGKGYVPDPGYSFSIDAVKKTPPSIAICDAVNTYLQEHKTAPGDFTLRSWTDKEIMTMLPGQRFDQAIVITYAPASVSAGQSYKTTLEFLLFSANHRKGYFFRNEITYDHEEQFTEPDDSVGRFRERFKTRTISSPDHLEGQPVHIRAVPSTHPALFYPQDPEPTKTPLKPEARRNKL